MDRRGGWLVALAASLAGCGAPAPASDFPRALTAPFEARLHAARCDRR
jgi:hypothetical protein